MAKQSAPNALIDFKVLKVVTVSVDTPYYFTKDGYAYFVKNKNKCRRLGYLDSNLSDIWLDPSPPSIGPNLSVIPIGDDDIVVITQAQYNTVKADVIARIENN